MKLTAGILLYKTDNNQLKVLLAHPGGPFWARKDAGAWSIPKGIPEDGEEDLELVARREYEEEIGQPLKATTLLPLTPVKQKSGKVLHAWAAEGDLDVTTVKSNEFELEYPAKSGRYITIPEVDRAEWFTIEEARVKLNAGQVPILDELFQLLKS